MNRGAGISRQSLPVFSAAERVWTIGEVLATAPYMGASAGAPEHRPRGLPPTGKLGDVEAAVQAFRYRHQLVSGEECSNWLAARGLKYADLHAALTRQVHAKPPPDATAIEIDLILSDQFARLAGGLAARVAVAMQADDAVTGTVDACWLPLESRYRTYAALAADPLARQRLLQTERLKWVQIAFEQIEFDRLDAAREARLCVLEDGQNLRELALAGRFAHSVRCERVSALPLAWAHALTSTPPGGLTPVIRDGERLLLLGVTRIIEPSLGDPAVLAGIDAQLLEQQLEPLLARHVRWVLNGIG